VTGSVAADIIVGGTGNDNLDGAGGDDLFLVSGNGGRDQIIGGSGFDTIRATAANTKIGLNSVGGIEAIDAGGFANVTIVGTNGSDSLDLTGATATGISAIDMGAGDDTLIASDSADFIRGGIGADFLTGGLGADVFSYKLVGESRSTSVDIISDFVTGEDLIDLQLIDANTKVVGDQAFSFIGSSSFHKVAGELRADTSIAGVTKIYGDINGDGKSDFEVQLSGTHNLAITDFIL
jgi:Ca2+-binding RTX toxin-like protein